MAESSAVKSASANLRRMEKGTHQFVVESFSLSKGIGVGKSIDSQDFVVGGHRWVIRFFPDGFNEGAHKAGFSSLTVSLDSDTTRIIQALVELQILDRSGRCLHVQSCFRNGLPHPHPLGYPLFGARGSMWGVPNAVKLGRVEDDCLVVRGTVGVLLSDIRYLPNSGEFDVSEIAIGAGLWETKQGADVMFRIGDEVFAAHRCIIAARSPVLRLRVLESEEEIAIPDIEPCVWKVVLQFMYLGTFQEEEEDGPGASTPVIFESYLGKMLAAADRFQLKRLQKICESRLLAKLSVESFAYVLHLAELHHAQELKAGCLKFVVQNQSAILQSEGCEYLKGACPELFLELNGFNESKQEKTQSFWSRIFSFLDGAFSTRAHWDLTNMVQERKLL